MSIKISHPNGIVNGHITLGGSKSISNRVLVIQHLCNAPFDIENLSDSDDTKALMNILSDVQDVNDVHHAGTTFRFLTSVLSFSKGIQTLTGSDRMKERPIGPLVEALRTIGADIKYLGQEGYPPLLIGELKATLKDKIEIRGDISSQYISSLLLVAPTLPNGLEININGDLVSTPYVHMTLEIMRHFGIEYTWEDNSIHIQPQKYKAESFYVESDWSSASYHYSILAQAKSGKITIDGLVEDSLQADRAIADISNKLGIRTMFDGRRITLIKESREEQFIEYDFIKCPDIAQTVFVAASGLGMSGLFSGLKTLKIKETDRIEACQQELMKVNCFLSMVPQRFKTSEAEMYMLDGSLSMDEPVFDTYKDHRMAMAFAPLALHGAITINEENVVSKSYPKFWDDLMKLDFKVESLT